MDSSPKASSSDPITDSTRVPSTPIQSKGVNTDSGDPHNESTDEGVGGSVWSSLRLHTARILSGSWTSSPAQEGPHQVPRGPTTSIPVTQPRNLASQIKRRASSFGTGSSRRYPIGFSFSPAGLLLPYHLGVIDYLTHVGALRRDVPLEGASAGAIAIAVAALEIPLDQIMSAVYRMEHVLRCTGTRGHLKKLLERELERSLPEDCHRLMAEREARASVIYTRVNFWKTKVVSEFADKEDLIECVLASCNIPFYFGHGPVIECRGQWAVDGYFSDRKNFGCPPNSNWQRQIRVTPFSKSQVLSHLPDFDVISPELSKYDKTIPRDEFEKFKTYLKENPAPVSRRSRRSRSQIAASEYSQSCVPEVVVQVSSACPPGVIGMAPSAPPTIDAVIDDRVGYSRDTQSLVNFTASEEDVKRERLRGDKRTSVGKSAPTAKGQTVGKASHGSRGRTRRSFSGDCFGQSNRNRSGTVRSEVSEEEINELEKEVPSQKKNGVSFLAPFSFMKAFTENVTPPSLTASVPTNDSQASRSQNLSSGYKDSSRPSIYDSQGVRVSATESSRKKGSHWRRRSHRRSVSDPAPQYTEEGLLKFTFTWMDLLNYALKPTPTDDLLQDLFDLGRADAFRWVCLDRLFSSSQSNMTQRGEDNNG